jgi:GTP-binding protein EngB required for normal cell division
VQAKVLYLEPASLKYELPKPVLSDHTEVAVIGRSNVGKSSLVGALLGPAGAKMVRVSKRPGT